MTKSDAKELLSRCRPGETITWFLQNGFSVICERPDKVEDITSTAITGVDATGRKFCAPLDYIQLGQIKKNNGRHK